VPHMDEVNILRRRAYAFLRIAETSYCNVHKGLWRNGVEECEFKHLEVSLYFFHGFWS